MDPAFAIAIVLVGVVVVAAGDLLWRTAEPLDRALDRAGLLLVQSSAV